MELSSKSALVEYKENIIQILYEDKVLCQWLASSRFLKTFGTSVSYSYADGQDAYED